MVSRRAVRWWKAYNKNPARFPSNDVLDEFDESYSYSKYDTPIYKAYSLEEFEQIKFRGHLYPDEFLIFHSVPISDADCPGLISIIPNSADVLFDARLLSVEEREKLGLTGTEVVLIPYREYSINTESLQN